MSMPPTPTSSPLVVLRSHLQPSDLEAIRALVETTRMFSRAETEIAAELVEESLRNGTNSDYRFTVAESGGQVLGYACFGPIPCTVSSYDLYWIAVHPSKQQSGIGRRILNDVEKRVAEIGGTRVYVDTSGRDAYAPTRMFYERMAYTKAAVLQDFYAPGDSKVIYVKPL